ncbi:MAG TPA: DUF309 domain-containing protein [Candidatus Eremiobacteraceae bacterium]|nr:DUF309 domain-containing protein [Candidatus Eremiobacteraceae bacterium]
MSDVNEPEYDAFISCWNDARFFEAHEVLEGLWIRTRDEFQRGLIQLAAALYHIQRQNLKGALTMCDRALPRLKKKSGFPSPVSPLPLIDYAERLRRDLSASNGMQLIDARPRL